MDFVQNLVEVAHIHTCVLQVQLILEVHHEVLSKNFRVERALTLLIVLSEVKKSGTSKYKTTCE